MAVPAVGTLLNRGGYNPKVRVRGSHAAHTWRAGRGIGQGWGGGRTRRTGAPLRVGKRHHVVRGVHFQAPSSLCCCVCAPALYLCVCFRPAARLPHSPLSRSACALCSVLLLLFVLVLASDFVVTLHLHFFVTFMYYSEY